MATRRERLGTERMKWRTAHGNDVKRFSFAQAMHASSMQALARFCHQPTRGSRDSERYAACEHMPPCVRARTQASSAQADISTLSCCAFFPCMTWLFFFLGARAPLALVLSVGFCAAGAAWVCCGLVLRLSAAAVCCFGPCMHRSCFVVGCGSEVYLKVDEVLDWPADRKSVV